MDYKHYHYLNIDNETFVFDTYYLLLTKITSKQKSIIDNYFENIQKNSSAILQNIKYSGEKDIIEHYIEKGYFVSPINLKKAKTEALGQISVTPMHNCNLRCSYCFATHGKNYKFNNKSFSIKNIDKLLNIVYFDIFKDMNKIHIDFVGGGEPFLNVDIIEYLKNKAIELDKKTNKKTSIFICSNGTIMTERILNIIDSPKINLGISFDGNKEQHDSMRRDAYGNGTYDTILKNIEYIKKNSIYRNLKNLWALVVITPKTKSLVEILLHHKKIGFSSVQMKLIRISKDKELSINSTNILHIKNLYKELTIFLINEIRTGDISFLKMILNNNDYFGKIILRLIANRIYIRRCAAGRSKISITANGDVFPCDSFIGNKNMKLFNIYNYKFDLKNNLLYDLNITKRKKCNICWGKYLCGGDCPHNSFLASGNVYDPDPFFCEIQLFLIESAIQIFYELLKKPELFKEISRFIEIREKLLL